MVFRRPRMLVGLFLLLGVADVIVLLGGPTGVVATWQRWADRWRAATRRGFVARHYVDPTGRLYRYVVFVPEDRQPGQRLPLILYLNGLGKNGTDGIKPLRDGLAPALWPVKDGFRCIVVWPQCGRDEAWLPGSPAAERAMALLRRTMQEYPVDPERIYLTGLSSGGSGVWHLGTAYPETFAALAPMSGSVADEQIARRAVEAGQAVWSFWCRGDDPSLVEANRTMHQSLLRLGASPRFTELDATGSTTWNRHDAWSYAYRNTAFWRWLVRQRRGRAQTGFRMVSLEDAARRGSIRGAGAWSGSPLVGRIEKVRLTESESARDGPNAGFAPSLPSGREDGGDGSRTVLVLPLGGAVAEMHVEFCPDENVTGCGVGLALSGPNGTPTGPWVHLVLDARAGSGGLRDLRTGEMIGSACDPVSERAVRIGEWNDLRIRVREGRLEADLNGWPLFEQERLERDTGADRVALVVVGRAGSEVAWRNLRVLEQPGPRKRTRPPVPVRLDDCGPTADTTTAPAPVGRQRPAKPKPGIEPRGVPEVPRLETVLRAWRAREASIRRMRLAWRLVRTHREPWSSLGHAVAGSVSKKGDPTECCVLQIEGDAVVFRSPWWARRARVSVRAGLQAETPQREFFRLLEGRFARPSDQRTRPLRWASRRKGLHRTDVVWDRSRSQGCGFLWDDSDRRARLIGRIEELLVLAPLLALRPLGAEGAAIQAQRCRLVQTGMGIRGRRCTVLEERVRERNPCLVRRYWSDETRQFVIVRMATFRDGRLCEQVDVDYRADDVLGGTPSGWDVLVRRWPAPSTSPRHFPGNAQLLEAARAEVVAGRLLEDKPVAQESDGPPQRWLPAGAMVYEQRSGRWYRQGDQGPSRALTQEEILSVISGVWDEAKTTSLPWPVGMSLAGLALAVAAWTIQRCRMAGGAER